jgi:hypothetical protein
MQNALHKNNSNNIVTVQEDPETRDLLVPIPDHILKSLNWNENTLLDITYVCGKILIEEKHGDNPT